MQIIPAAVQTLLKSLKMTGADRPAYEVTIAGQPAGSPDFSGTPDWTLQGRSSTLISVSNWLQKTNGNWMCCWFDPTSKELQTGFSADLDFLETDYAIESVVATPAITVDAVFNNQCSLYKRDDGSVLIFVVNISTTSWTKCFVSASGNGDDWAYYSTIISVTESSVNVNRSYMGIPIKTATGRLIVTFIGGGSPFGVIYPETKVSWSDNDGLTWTTVYHGSYSTSRGIGQPCQLPDGSLFFIEIQSSTANRLFKSVDNGSTWASVLDIYTAWGTSVSFLLLGTTAYALCLSKGFYQIENPTATTFADPANWTKLFDLAVTTELCGRLYLCDNHFALHNAQNSTIYDTEMLTPQLTAKSINIDRSRGAAAAQAMITLDNTGGQYSPDGAGDWAGVIMPNALITVKQGYGADLAQTFVGYIDSVEMTNFPAELRIACRDKAKLALDRIITNAEDGGHYKKYLNKTVEYIVGDLTSLCGLSAGTIEATGMTLTSKLFSWESYADAIDWLADISSSSWRVDELGALHFTRDVMPVSPMTAYSFAEGEDIISLGYMISDQDLYYTATVYGTKDYTGTVNTSGVTVTWVSGDKFSTTWPEDKIITIDGSTYRINAVASDTSLTVKATIGTKTGVNYQLTDVIKASANFGAPLTYGLFSQKVLKIDAPDADTVAACQEIADRAVALMLCRCRVVDFAAIAVPWLQVGDFIQVTETTSTISELYRVTDISLNQDPSGFTMGITCYWYGEVPT